MCLRLSGFQRLDGGEGIGYKWVRPTTKMDEFRPEYRNFGHSTNDPRWPGSHGISKGGVAARVIYKIGRTYRVRHGRETMTYFSGGFSPYTTPPEVYPAGVHLYKKPPDGLCLKCRYRKAVAQDHTTIVAMEVTPIAYGVF